MTNVNNFLTLADIKKASKIKTKLNSGKEVFITFFYLDGLYSYCTIDDGDSDNVIHLSWFTPLKQVNNYYEIIE